jgi:protein-tyrosine-phosphatase
MSHRVLFLCTGNSARSIIAEYLLNLRGKGRFEAFSAGSNPTGVVNPLALWVLDARYGIDARGARSKSWVDFKDDSFDFIITVCDNAREACPVWLGHPIVAHWSSPDPAACHGTEEQKKWAFVQVAAQIAGRIDLLCGLPDASISEPNLQRIGDQAPAVIPDTAAS